MDYTRHFARGATPQTEPARRDQVQNSAGGYTFKIDRWGRLARFLILGADGGTYYASERKLTRENALIIDECLAEDPARTVETIADVSHSGRAPKNDPAIFALSLAASSKEPGASAAAFDALSRVCRTGTHLLQFVAMTSQHRGWGRAMRNAIAGWYAGHTQRTLMYQLAKYRNRGGWTHRDVLRKCHWAPSDAELQAVVRWAIGAPGGSRTVKRGDALTEYAAVGLPDYLQAFDELQKTDSSARVVQLIGSHRFTHEMIPSQFLNDGGVWEALLVDMPIGALVRNLGKLTSIGLAGPMSSGAKRIVEKLSNSEALTKSRLHPLAVLTALGVYRNGRGMKGSLTWTPNSRIIDALDDAFYVSFGNVPSTGKETMLALDVSGSMTYSTIAGSPLTPRAASAAMAMVVARTEPNHAFFGFGSTFRPLPISPKQRLDDVMRMMDGLPFSTTDCSLPMVHAIASNMQVDVFQVYTDNETYAGRIHPFQALQQYRQKSGRNAKLAVVGMTATDFTIADPTDSGMLDVVGFDTAAPNILADFASAR